MPISEHSCPKWIQGYNGQVRKKPVTYAIYPCMQQGTHKKSTVPFLIANIGHHDAILGKTWMNKNRLLLDINNDTIIYSKGPSTPQANQIPPKILPRPKPQAEYTPILIHAIGAAVFHSLATKPKSENIQLFAMSMQDIDAQLAFHRDAKVDTISLSSVESAAQNREEILAKLPPHLP